MDFQAIGFIRYVLSTLHAVNTDKTGGIGHLHAVLLTRWKITGDANQITYKTAQNIVDQTVPLYNIDIPY